MAGSRGTTPTTQLIGRDPERAEIDRLLAAAAQGESGSVVVRGEAGIGKSALLDYAAHRADGMTVLRATGVDAESDLAFAGLYGLVRPVIGYLKELPETQAAALGGALGLARSAGPDRFLVSAAVLGLLAAAADDTPVLCVIDDAQWLDTPSAEALVFVARRLRAERIAIVFAAREGDVRSFHATGIPELLLAGLDAAAATALFAERTAAMAAGVRGRLLDDAAGNPLALLELPAALSADQLAGSSALPKSVPLTARLQEAFLGRFELLPEQTRALLLIAAADDTGDASTILRAGAELELPPAALDPAEAGDLVRTEGSRIAFRHPLVRSAVYGAATLSQRQRVHSALASVLAGEEHADRRVWHQAMATLAADEEVAAALEASARRSQLRGGHASAATAYLRAAELSTDGERRTRRIAAAAQAAWDAGHLDRARECIDGVLPDATGDVKAQLLHLRGVIEARAGRLRAAYETLLEAVEATNDPSLQLEMLHEAAEAASFSGNLEEVSELGRRAMQIPAASERDHFMAAMLVGFARVYADEHREGEALLADALRRADALDDPRALVWASNAASVAEGPGAGLPYANRAVDLARRRGLLSQLPLSLQRQAGELLLSSKFDAAYAAAEEGYRLAVDLGFAPSWLLMAMASVEVLWGRYDDARGHAEQALAIAQQTGEQFLLSSAELTLAFIELSAGRWDQATARLLELTAGDRPGSYPITARSATPDLVEAAARAGRDQEIAEPLERFREWVSSVPSEGGRALLARCEALLHPSDEQFAEAIDCGRALSPFQRARTELLYGEWLRRERRRQEARVHLREALELFRRLGVRPWEDRAAVELRATGETARRRDPSTLDDLTPQELQIATLVAQGMTNREIAGRLFLSPRTVDYHLRKVFSKLGIASRTDLVRAGVPGRESPVPPR